MVINLRNIVKHLSKPKQETISESSSLSTISEEDLKPPIPERSASRSKPKIANSKGYSQRHHHPRVKSTPRRARTLSVIPELPTPRASRIARVPFNVVREARTLCQETIQSIQTNQIASAEWLAQRESVLAREGSVKRAKEVQVDNLQTEVLRLNGKLRESEERGKLYSFD